MVCADKTMCTLPANCGDINHVPRLPSSTKLQKKIAVEGGTFEYEPWRTQENHMSEWMEIIHRFTKPGDCIWDPCCGTMPVALAAFRLKRMCIASDQDEELVEAARWRVMYYQHWATKTYSGLEPGDSTDPDPPEQDGLNNYRFHQIFVPNSALGKNQAALPYYTTAPRDLKPVDDPDYKVYCHTMGVEVQDSTLAGAGQGLFLIAPRRVGDINEKGTLRVPYYGNFSRKIVSDRSICLQSSERNGDPIYITGNDRCPAGFVNDPLVRPCFFFVFFLFVNPKTI